jgi:hypothetical protein
MPRDGLQQYSPPPGTEGIPNYTVESARYNALVADVTQDLNLPRPIVAGGTGASSADQALFNLSGEEAAQLVTNWDSMLWSPGSFYAAASALGSAPLAGHAFAGICYINEPLANPPTNQNVIVEARDLDPVLTVPLWVSSTIYDIGASARDSADNTVWKATAQNISGAATFALARAALPGIWVADTAIQPTRYTRIKKAGVWGAWLADVTAQAVRYDAVQYLTTGEQAQARKNVYAAPFDALAYNGMQINGSMEVSQEKGSGSVPIGAGSVDAYVVDGWQVSKTGSSTLDAGQLSNEVPGIRGALQIRTTVAQPSIGSDFVRFRALIEGYRTQRAMWGTAKAMPITVGFWARMSLPGTYRVLIHNDGITTTSAWVPFTINVSLVWQWITVQIPGVTTGVWKNDNGIGMVLLIEVASSATPNTVSAVNQYAGITGVVVLPGIEAPSAARSPLIMRPYDQELVTCQRYYEKSGPQSLTWAGNAIVGNNYASSTQFRVQKRANPAMTFPGAYSASNFGSISSTGTTIDTVTGSALANISAPYIYWYSDWIANARL